MPDLTEFSHISLATYYRLLILNLLPKSVPKVIYLDCDIIVRKSILDDSSLCTDYKPLVLSSFGHPWSSQIADEIDQTEFEEIISVGHNRMFRKKL